MFQLNQKLFDLDSLLIVSRMKIVQKLILLPFDLFKSCHLLLNLVVEFLLQCRDYFVLLQHQFVQMDILLRQVQVLLFQEFKLAVGRRSLVDIV